LTDFRNSFTDTFSRKLYTGRLASSSSCVNNETDVRSSRSSRSQIEIEIEIESGRYRHRTIKFSTVYYKL